MKRPLKRWLNKFNVKLVILTHAHVDHTWNTAYLKELYGCDVALGINDLVNIILSLNLLLRDVVYGVS